MNLFGSLALAGTLLSAPVALAPATATETNATMSAASCDMPSCPSCDACPCGMDCTQ